MLYYPLRLVFWCLIRLGWYHLIISGQEMIPTTGPVILAANHFGPIDPLFMAYLTNRKIHFMARSYDWLHDFCYTLLVGFPVRKGQPDRSALQSSIKLLSNGEIIGLMAIGHRQKNNSQATPQRGACWIAHHSELNPPVIPIGIYWHYPNSLFPRAIISIVCGQPLLPSSFPHDTRGKEMNEELGRRITQLRLRAQGQVNL